MCGLQNTVWYILAHMSSCASLVTLTTVRYNSPSLVLRLTSVCSFHSLSCTCGADNFVHSQKHLRFQIFHVVVRGADKIMVTLISFALSRYSLDYKLTFASLSLTHFVRYKKYRMASDCSIIFLRTTQSFVLEILISQS